MSVRSLYDADFYAWTVEQAKLLEGQQWEQLDVPNLIEEIESLGRQQRQELRSRLSVLLGHLLKWQYQPRRRSRSWLATIRIQRRDILRLLQENPSLKPALGKILEDAFANARDLAIAETDLPEQDFPSECLYSLAEILDEVFYPGEPSELS